MLQDMGSSWCSHWLHWYPSFLLPAFSIRSFVTSSRTQYAFLIALNISEAGGSTARSTPDFLKCSPHFHDHVTTRTSCHHFFLYLALSFHLPSLQISTPRNHEPTCSFHPPSPGNLVHSQRVTHSPTINVPVPGTPARPFLHSHSISEYLVNIFDKYSAKIYCYWL